MINMISRLTTRVPVVMVVDDQEVNVRLAGTLLAQAGTEIVPALSGEQALARAAVRPPDLVLLDMRMPEMDGLEVLRRWRANPETVGVPVIILTASTERADLVRAFDHGAVDFLTKPFVAEELLARVRSHLELKLTRDHLHRIAREREELAAIVAHDLKTPLSSILFGARMADRPGLDPERARKLAQGIVASTESALSFIARYLEKRADGELLRALTLTPIRLTDAVTRVLAAFEFAVQSKEQRVTPRVVDDVVVMADTHALDSVIGNLVSNAVKYSPIGAEIELLITRGAPGMGRVCVLDAGPGIDDEQRRRLFQRFVRLGNQPTARESSSGFGLALAKQDVAQMRGELWHEPREGGGSVFILELPLEPEAAVER
jgi:signal transduction histidine kinase